MPKPTKDALKLEQALLTLDVETIYAAGLKHGNARRWMYAKAMFGEEGVLFPAHEHIAANKKLEADVRAASEQWLKEHKHIML